MLYKFKTLTISFPILSDDPIETVLGISDTNKSSIFPIEGLIVIVFARPTVSVFIPILKDPVKLIIELLNPETDIESPLFISTNGR